MRGAQYEEAFTSWLKSFTCILLTLLCVSHVLYVAEPSFGSFMCFLGTCGLLLIYWKVFPIGIRSPIRVLLHFLTEAMAMSVAWFSNIAKRICYRDQHQPAAADPLTGDTDCPREDADHTTGWGTSVDEGHRTEAAATSGPTSESHQSSDCPQENKMEREDEDMEGKWETAMSKKNKRKAKLLQQTTEDVKDKEGQGKKGGDGKKETFKSPQRTSKDVKDKREQEQKWRKGGDGKKETLKSSEQTSKNVKDERGLEKKWGKGGDGKEGKSPEQTSNDVKDERDQEKKGEMGGGGKKKDNSKLEKKQPKPFSYTLEEFGYSFNKNGRLTNKDGRGYVFDEFPDHHSNQQRYEALGNAVTEHIYGLLESEGGLQRVTLPVDLREGEPTTHIFTSRDALTNPDRLLLLIHGSGAVRAGQWARRLIINDCLDSGTQLPYIKRAQENGYAVMVLNTNDNYSGHRSIRGNSSPDNHASYVWDHFVERSRAARIDIVAHSAGGCATVHLAKSHFKAFSERVKKIAFTDSVHSLGGGYSNSPSGKVSEFMIEHSINWVSSSAALGQPLDRGYHDVPRVSAGTPKHEVTSHAAFEAVFAWFLKEDEDEDTGPEEERMEDGGQEDQGRGEQGQKNSRSKGRGRGQAVGSESVQSPPGAKSEDREEEKKQENNGTPTDSNQSSHEDPPEVGQEATEEQSMES